MKTFREVHEIFVAAPPDDVDAAVREVALRDMPVARALLAARGLRGRHADRPVLDLLCDQGFVVLEDEPGKQIVLGVVGRFWKLRREAARALPDAGAFAAFAEPGYAKAVMSFRLEPEAGGVRLTTETAIKPTDERARRSFGHYWRLIRPGSGLVRIAWLRAVKRRAERR